MNETNVVEAPQGEQTEKETPQDSGGTGNAVNPEPGQQPGQDSAGGEQSLSQDGSGNNQPTRNGRGTSPFAENRRLQAKLREQEAAFNSRFTELNTRIEELTGYLRNGGKEEDPSGAFFVNPSKVLRSELGNFKKEMLQELLDVQSQSKEQLERKQEMSEAVKFVRSQNGMTDGSVQEVQDILSEIPGVENLPPMAQAKIGIGLWLQEKGITNKAPMKARAGMVNGAPPAQRGGRTWSEAEIEKELSVRFPRDQKDWTPEIKAQFQAFDREIKQAMSEGRVK